MKKVLFALALGSGLSSTSQAADTYFGVRVMGETTGNVGLGAQVTYDADRYALRLGLNARSFLGFSLGLGGDVAALFPVYGTQDTRGRVQVGGGVDLERHNGVMTLIRPHLLVNGEYRLLRFATVFAESSLGYSFFKDVGRPGGAFSPGLRLGLNFR